MPCGKRFAKQTTYDAHLSGSKHLRALKQLSRVEFVAALVRVAINKFVLPGTVPDVSEAVERACEAPDMYVLKPQREGGGNNLFGAELRDALRSMGAAERAAYILMERIVPPTHPASLMRGGELDGGECACELGVFGVFLGDGQRTLLNEEAGHLLRVKLDGVDEGGVCAGFACLSSPALYP